MLTNADITIFNKRLSEDRREIYIPTILRGVSFYKENIMSQSDIDRRGTKNVTIRIPFNVDMGSRTYIKESMYKQLSNEEALKYWTIQRGDYIVSAQVNGEDWIWDTFSFTDGIVTGKEINNLKKLREVESDFITITNYADNTKRGSDRVKHWRIGGA